MILKRLLSNIIDIALYFIVLFFIYKLSGSKRDPDSLILFYISSFFTTFIIPILFIKNTFGKAVLNLEWVKTQNLVLKLCAKYMTYFLAHIPGFSIISAVFSFPYLNSIFKSIDVIIVYKLFIAFATTDLFLFFFSKGKLHIVDYFLDLKLNKVDFKNSRLGFLKYTFLFFGVYFFISVSAYNNKLEFKQFNAQGIKLYKEHFPPEQYYGQTVYVHKEKSPVVFNPYHYTSFLYSVFLPQKTIFLNLPEEVFKSKSNRHEVCKRLIIQSIENDFWSEFKPVQTRIILSSSSRGVFLDYFQYEYIYYFENNLPEWGIHGGIKTDSTTINSYTDFIHSFKTNLIQEKIKIEQKYDLSFQSILELSKDDPNFYEKLKWFNDLKLASAVYDNRVEINLSSSKIIFDKIDFSDKEPRKFRFFQYPMSQFNQNLMLKKMTGDKLLFRDEADEKLYFLRSLIELNEI